MSDDAAIQAARAVLDAHLEALNAHDEIALADTLHFPHYRLSEGQLKVWDHPEAYFSDFRKRAGAGWGHTEWGEITPLQVGTDKVHLAVRVDRFREDGSALNSFPSLWVVSRIGGKWAAQLRSSFAQDSACSRAT